MRIDPRYALAALAIPAVLLTGCERGVAKIRNTAEDARRATEHFAASTRAQNDEREALIASQAEPLGQAEAVVLGERFYLQAEGGGWSIMDRASGQYASIGGQMMSDMPLDEAENTLADLRADTEN